MQSQTQGFVLRASVLAVQGVLAIIAMTPPARAADPTVAELTQPTNTAEVGIVTTNSGDFKAHEYDGIKKKGTYLNGGFDVRGGGAYDSDSATRWRATGANLGLENRSLGVEYGNQGHYRFMFGYDELLWNKSDTYQTPYQGAGGNNLVLPGGWIVPTVPRVSATAANARGLSGDVAASPALVNGVPTNPTAAQLGQSNTLIGTDVPMFNNVNLTTKRTAYDVGFTLALTPAFELTAGLRHEDRKGLKPMGTVTRFTGGDISTIIPDLIDQSTDQINLGLNYRQDKYFVQGGYYGSLFRNNVNAMSWNSWTSPANTQTMSSAPSNQFHQLNLTGGYNFSKATRLVGNLSYGRNTQNDGLLTDVSTPLVPVASLNGLVITKSLNLKLTDRTTKNLSLAAAYKFDERDNRTPVNTFAYYDAGEVKTGTSLFNAYFPGAALGSNANINANRPYSKKLNQANFDADYALNKTNALKAGLDWQKVDRYCNGSWIDCADASTTTEKTLRAEWRSNPTADFNARVGLAHASRTVNYNENAFLALVPAANLSPTGAPAGSTAYGTMTALGLTGYGPVSGLTPAAAAGSAQAFFFANNNALANALYGNQNRISELPGMRRYNMADRTRDKVRMMANWQANDQWSFQGGLDLNKDDYSNSVYGLQSAKGFALNLDATYAPTEDLSLTAFYTWEDQKSVSAGNSYTANSTAANVNGFTAITGGCYGTIATRNANNKVDPCLNWTSNARDRVDTIGFQARQRNLMSGKVDFGAGLLFSWAKSTNGIIGGNYANNPLAITGAAPGTTAAYYIQATDLPSVNTSTAELRLNARYAIDKSQSVRLAYSFLYMNSSDYSYSGLAYGGLTGVLPTNQTSPSFRVHTLAVAYQYTWQ